MDYISSKYYIRDKFAGLLKLMKRRRLWRKTPAEEAMVEEMPAEEATDEEAPAEEAMSAEDPVEEAIAEEAPAEGTAFASAPAGLAVEVIATPERLQEFWAEAMTARLTIALAAEAESSAASSAAP